MDSSIFLHTQFSPEVPAEVAAVSTKRVHDGSGMQGTAQGHTVHVWDKRAQGGQKISELPFMSAARTGRTVSMGNGYSGVGTK